ncbi:lactonase family protein [Flavitalea flava]
MRLSLLTLVLLLSLSGLAQKYYLFIGTYTNTSGHSKGIYVYQFNAATGDFKPVSTAVTENPSYLALSPGGKSVYAVNETGGTNPGGVSAFSFDKTTGHLQFLNKQESGGDDPCYLSVDAGRKWLMVANYSGGSLSALPLRADGSIGALTQSIQHTGTGADKSRQEKPHVHSVTFTPDQRFLVAADLGLDKLSIYRFNPGATDHPLSALQDSSVVIKPASGPRHISFYPGKPWVYLMNEMSGVVDVFHYAKGKFTLFQQISSHPAGYSGDIGSADIHVAPGGKYLYASNRGDADNIVVYAVDSASGKLTVKGFQSTLGKGPRNFVIDPTGHWLLAANQRTDNVVIYRIDPQTGLLTPSGKQIQVPSPVCLKILKN